MSSIRGTFRRGQVELDQTINWDDGLRVAVTPLVPEWGLAESDWADTQSTRGKLLSLLDAIEPLELMPEEESEIGEARAAIRDASVRAVRHRMGMGP